MDANDAIPGVNALRPQIEGAKNNPFPTGWAIIIETKSMYDDYRQQRAFNMNSDTDYLTAVRRYRVDTWSDWHYNITNIDLKNYVSIIDNGSFGISKISQQHDTYSSGIQFSINNGDKLLQLEITTSNQLMGRCKWVHASDWSSWKQLI